LALPYDTGNHQPSPRPPIRFDLANIALATAAVVLVLEVFQFLHAIQNVLILLIIAIILSTALDPLVNALRRLGFERTYGVLLIYLILVAGVGLFLFVIAQIVIAEFLALIAALPLEMRRLAFGADSLPPGPLHDAAVDLIATTNSLLGQGGITGVLNSGTLSGLVFATFSVVESVFAAVTVLVVAYFWLAERSSIRRSLIRLVPARHRSTVLAVWETVEYRLGAWSRGQLVLMFVVGTIQGVGYAILGLPFAALLGVWAGIAELIPMIGPYLGAAPALLIALTRGPEQALIVAGFALVVNIVESNVLVPRIMAHAVGLSPLTVIVALLAGAAVGGIIGALLAVPLAAAIQAALFEIEQIRATDS
jgi:predicted PurR-regulated permease PerM